MKLYKYKYKSNFTTELPDQSDACNEFVNFSDLLTLVDISSISPSILKQHGCLIRHFFELKHQARWTDE